MPQPKTCFVTVEGLSIKVIFSKRKTATIEVRHGEALARVPLRTPAAWLTHFLTQRAGWVREHLAQQQVLLATHTINPWEARCLPYLGQSLPLQVVAGARASSATLTDEHLVISLGRRSTKVPEQLTNELTKLWLKEQAKEYLSERLDDWSAVMKLQPSELKVANFKSSWGQCNSRGRIALNWHLMMAPPEVIDYVVIHELAHLEEMNHSARFWALVHRHCHHVDQSQAFLRERGVWLQWR